MINKIREWYLKTYKTINFEHKDADDNILYTETFRYTRKGKETRAAYKYAVGELGNFLHIKTQNIRANTPKQDGYVTWSAKRRRRNGTSKSVNINAHREINRMFNGWSWPWKRFVHHINGTKNDNRAVNLIAVSGKEHAALHCGKAKIVNRKVVYL